MLITEFVDVSIGSKNFKYYKELGYDIKKNDIINIPIEQLTIGSHVIVEVECDFCHKIILKKYKDYLKSKKGGKDCCVPCRGLKTKELWLKKYKVNHPLKLEKFKKKRRDGMINKYGVGNPMDIPNIQEKINNINLKKYGAKNYNQTDEGKRRIRKRWTNTSKEEIENIVSKRKKTCLDKYGYEHALQVPEIKEKVLKTLLSYDNTPTSNQQIEVFKIVKTLFGENNVFLNYPFIYYSLDTALFINEIKIDIEYDGWYWHQDIEKDKIRNSYLIESKWKVLRIKSGCKIPTVEQLQESLDVLINTDETYQEIILDDWKEVVA